MKKSRLLLIGTILVIGLLTACSGGAKDQKEKDTETVKKNLTLCESWDFNSGFFTVLSPNLTANFGPYNYLPNFYDTLVKYDHGKIVSSLAESWKVSKDKKEYIFKLKKGVKFSDGEDLTAEAVKKSMENVPKLLGKYNGAFGITSTIIKKVEAIDKNTIKLVFTTPYYGVLHDLTMTNTFGIMSPKAYNEDGTLSKETKTKTFGTGPYMYKGEKKDGAYHFVSNSNYYGEKPEVTSFNVKTIPDNDSKLLAFQSGEVDMILGSANISYDSYNKFKEDGKIKGQISKNKDVTRIMGLNASKKPFNSREVRLAINHAIDKNSISKDIFYGLEDVAKSFLSPDLPYCNVGLKGYDYNVKEAEKILEQAGWKKNFEGIREKDGVKLKGNLLYLSGMADEQTLATKISSDLRKIGIKLYPKALERNTLFQTIGSGKYEAALQTTYGLPYDPYLVIANLNRQRIRDNLVAQGLVGIDGADKLIMSVNGMSDEKAIQEQYKKILTGVQESASLVPITYKKQVMLYNKNNVKEYDFYSIPAIYDMKNIKTK